MANAIFEGLLKQIQNSDLLRFNAKQNHAPMVLTAMYRMGANEDQLRGYFAKLEIASKKPDSPTRLSINAASWREYLGQFDALDAYCGFFQSEIAQHGTEAALRRYVPLLSSGVTAHAYHPLLRLAYGLDLNDPTEIALALAYWAATYLPGPAMPTERPEIAPVDLLKKLAGTSSLRKIMPQSRSIAARIQQFYSEADFCTALRPIPFHPGNPLAEISLAVAEAFVENHHFTMLHSVTGCCALRMVLPYCDNPRKTISEYWYSICAAYLSVVNLPGDKHRPLPETRLDWTEIKSRALATSVDHTIKLTYACLQECDYYGRDIYPLLALREIAAPAPFY